MLNYQRVLRNEPVGFTTNGEGCEGFVLPAQREDCATRWTCLLQWIDSQENLGKTMVSTTVYGGFKGIGIIGMEGITRDDSGFPNMGSISNVAWNPWKKTIEYNWKIAMLSKKTSGWECRYDGRCKIYQTKVVILEIRNALRRYMSKSSEIDHCIQKLPCSVQPLTFKCQFDFVKLS